MSIRRTTTIHCDDCGEWEYGGDSMDLGQGENTASRRKRGWQMWREGGWNGKGGVIRHRCPKCARGPQ